MTKPLIRHSSTSTDSSALGDALRLKTISRTINSFWSTCTGHQVTKSRVVSVGSDSSNAPLSSSQTLIPSLLSIFTSKIIATQRNEKCFTKILWHLLKRQRKLCTSNNFNNLNQWIHFFVYILFIFVVWLN